jgi:prepilin-type N-terminal cleavage/methylation domain-containing protein/prepilin-type processing-associated H-X9-DG protein
MSGHYSRGFTLVELIIVVVILGALFCLLVPAIQPVRVNARSNSCRNSMFQLRTALASRESVLREYPGYINTLGSPGLKPVRASWVVMTFPYIDQGALWEQWQNGDYTFSNVELLVCPSDPLVIPSQPGLSYVANSGSIANANGIENRGNGVFFDRTRIAAGAAGPEDERDKAGSPEIVMSLAYLQSHDGASHTLLLTESIHALQWGYTLPDEQANSLDRKYHFGFCWEQTRVLQNAIANQSQKSVRRINGNLNDDAHTKFSEMGPNDGFPSSNHPGGVNVAFVGGKVQFLSDNIDPLVYAQLMTSSSKHSDLRDTSGKPDGQLEQPDDDY